MSSEEGKGWVSVDMGVSPFLDYSESESDSDTMSQKSTTISTLEADEAFYEDIVDYFSLLTDKKCHRLADLTSRVKNRSAALERIQQCLLHNVHQDVFLRQYVYSFLSHPSADSLCTNLLSFIRKEKPVEVAISSCRILALLQLSLALGRLLLSGGSSQIRPSPTTSPIQCWCSEFAARRAFLSSLSISARRRSSSSSAMRAMRMCWS